jgi:hypothetical protein
MENQKVASIAKKLGVTTQAVYKKLAKLGNQVATELVKENGVTWLTPKGAEVLEESFGNKHPSGVATVGSLVATFPKGIEDKQAMIVNQQDMIRQFLEKQAEERQRSDSIIMKLAHDLEDTRRSTLAIEMKVNSLLPKIADPFTAVFNRPVTQVKAWSPPKVADPAARMGFLRRVWVEFTQPEQLRRTMES